MEGCRRIGRKDGRHRSRSSDRLVPSARLCCRQPCQIGSILAQATTPHGATLRGSRSSRSAGNNSVGEGAVWPEKVLGQIRRVGGKEEDGGNDGQMWKDHLKRKVVSEAVVHSKQVGASATVPRA